MKMRSRLDINLQVARRNIQKSGLRCAFLMRHSLSGLYFLNCDSYVTRPTTAQKPSRATRLTASQAISSRKFFEGWSNRILHRNNLCGCTDFEAAAAPEVVIVHVASHDVDGAVALPADEQA